MFRQKGTVSTTTKSLKQKLKDSNYSAMSRFHKYETKTWRQRTGKIPTSVLLCSPARFSIFSANICERKERFFVFSMTCWYGETAWVPITT